MQPQTDLNPAQLAAAEFNPDKPLVVLAGAGSGKTKVLTYRAAFLAGNNPEAGSGVLLLTFTNKAAAEMMSRAGRLAAVSASGISGGTFHSFCLKLLRTDGGEIGIRDNFSVFDESDQMETIRQAMRLLGIDPKTVRPGSVLAAISEAKNNLVKPADYINYARGQFQQTAARIYGTYQALLAKYNGLDFDDLLAAAVRLLQESEEVRNKTARRHRYILIDEYQDTNTAQYTLTKLLAGQHHRLTVVGDAAQAIYSWRGANYKNLLYLKQDFPEIAVVNLEQNYRSSQNILTAANEIIAKNKSHPILRLWTDNAPGDKIGIYRAENEADEAGFLAMTIGQEADRGRQLSDYAVLYRTNAQSRIIEEAFLHAGIPYRLVGGIRFYERKEIKDMLAYLRLLVNPVDETARTRAEKIGKTRLKYLEEGRGEIDLKAKTLDILDMVIRQTRYLEMFDQDNEEDLMRLENLKELRSVATEFPVISEFLQQIALSEKGARGKNFQTDAGSGEAVTLMTAHSAKGLEFATVFMVGMEEGLFPHSRSLMDPEQMEEERRLCYVGMTRAKNKLCLSFARKRMYFGQRNTNPVSRFVAEIPERLTDNRVERVRLGTENETWGFDTEGNWKWSPGE